MSRSYEFRTSDKNFMEILNNIFLINPYSRLIYNNQTPIIIGYITFKENIREAGLNKFSSKIVWNPKSSKELKKLNLNDFNFKNLKNSRIETIEKKEEELREKELKLKEKEEKLKEKEEELIKEKEKNEQKFEKFEEKIEEKFDEKFEKFKKEIKNKKSSQNIQININLNSFKDPSTDHMKNRDFLNFINAHGLNGLSNFVQRLYFQNRDNLSVFIDHDKYNQMYVYHNNNWLLTNRIKSINEIFDTCSNKLNTWCEDVTGETEIGDEDIHIDYIDEDDIEETRTRVDEKRNLLAENNKEKQNEIKLLIVNNSSKVKNLTFKPN